MMEQRPDFKTELRCRNCGKFSEFKFPYGTRIDKEGIKTIAYYPKTTNAITRTAISVHCPKCGSKRIS
jgi:DNA-directed RNA polymerase subunit RPC12/RpoP